MSSSLSGEADRFGRRIVSSAASTPVSSVVFVGSCSPGLVPDEPCGVSEDVESGPPSVVKLPLGPGGGLLPAGDAAGPTLQRQKKKRTEELEWPAVSYARMRAGLRSALKTDCSGFKFQNGGRSVRWFREHPDDTGERGRLFWQGHTSLFEQDWELVKCLRAFPLFDCLGQLELAFRKRYSVSGPVSRSVDRRHARAMLADGNVERAARWALDRRGEMEHTLLSREGGPDRLILLALALEGGWTWLLERWQAADDTFLGKHAWRAMVVASAIQMGSLALVQEHWPYIEEKDRRTYVISKAIGCSGSLEVFDWLADHGFVENVQAAQIDLVWRSVVKTALLYGHTPLVDDVLSRVPVACQLLNRFEGPFMCNASCMGDHLHAVEWFVSQTRAPRPGGHALGWAVRGASLAIMRYLREQLGVTGIGSLENHVEALVSQSRPSCLSVLEYLVQHYQYQPSSRQIAKAATAANVRPDVLRFLARHATRKTWNDALTRKNVRGDLDVQDLLQAAARGVRQLAQA